MLMLMPCLSSSLCDNANASAAKAAIYELSLPRFTRNRRKKKKQNSNVSIRLLEPLFHSFPHPVIQERVKRMRKDAEIDERRLSHSSLSDPITSWRISCLFVVFMQQCMQIIPAIEGRKRVLIRLWISHLMDMSIRMLLLHLIVVSHDVLLALVFSGCSV